MSVMRSGEGRKIISAGLPLGLAMPDPNHPSKLSKIEQMYELAKREGKSMSEVITELLLDWFEKHNSGNPAYTLDNWAGENFLATPAFFADIDSWKEYLSKIPKSKHSEIGYKLSEIEGVFRQL